MSARLSGLDGLFVGSHAVAQGVLSRHQLRSGVYQRVLHGVYADPAVRVDHEVKARAASLLMPERAAIGGVSAAWWHGGPLPDVTAPVTVVLPEGVEWKGPRGVRVHRTRLATGERTSVADVPCTVPLRTAWDVCALEPLKTAVGTIDAMLRSGSVSLDRLHDEVRRRVGRWGAARARRVLELADPRAESPPESWLRVAFVLSGLPPFVPQFDVVADGIFVGRVDFAWPEARLVVEYDGAYHFEGVQIARDDARIERLIAAGWRVIRISAADLRDLDAVVARVEAALRSGRVPA